MSEWLIHIISFGINGLISAVVSLITSRITLRNELKKLGFQYERDDTVSLRKRFADMRAAVLTYADVTTPPNKRQALSAISAFVAIAPPALQSVARQLQEFLLSVRPFSQEHGRVHIDMRKLNLLIASLDEQWLSISKNEDRHHQRSCRKSRRDGGQPPES